MGWWFSDSVWWATTISVCFSVQVRLINKFANFSRLLEASIEGTLQKHLHLWHTILNLMPSHGISCSKWWLISPFSNQFKKNFLSAWMLLKLLPQNFGQDSCLPNVSCSLQFLCQAGFSCSSIVYPWLSIDEDPWCFTANRIELFSLNLSFKGASFNLPVIKRILIIWVQSVLHDKG